MFEFINILKIIAAVLITNSHYGSVWPMPEMAAGGLLGNLLFFAVSGYGLFHIDDRFDRWYLKRIIRIYPSVFWAGLIELLAGYKKINNIKMMIKFFVYPTSYHFIASIMLLYIFFYIAVFINNTGILKLSCSMVFVAVAALIIYILFYDKSYYHIDRVEEYYIRFIFFEAMLFGAYIRSLAEKNFNRIQQGKYGLPSICMLIVYVISKESFLWNQKIAYFQMINQIVLFILMCSVFMYFQKLQLSGKFYGTNSFFKKASGFLAKLTLDIYIVQTIILRSMPKMAFPINFIIVTSFILAGAILINLISSNISKLFRKILERVWV